MMGYAYHLDEGMLDLPSGFQDKSQNILQWPLPRGACTIVIERAPLPSGWSFSEAVHRQSKREAKSVLGYAEKAALALELDIPAATRCFVGRLDGELVYHHRLFVDRAPSVLVMTARGPHAMRRHIDDIFAQAAMTLRLR